MNSGFELEKSYVEHRLMCDVSLMGHLFEKQHNLQNTVTWRQLLTDLQLQTEKGPKTCKITIQLDISSNSC